MIYPKKVLGISIALLSCLLLSFAFFLNRASDAHPVDTIARIPQEYMTNLTLTTYNEDGSLKDSLSAQHWAYLPEQNLSVVEKPHLTVYKPDQTFWNIDALHGKIEQPTLGSIEKITLQEKVTLERPQSATASFILVKSNEMQYLPKIQYAKTDELVTITKQGLQVTGTGMRAFLDKGSMELLHNVKTFYTKARNDG